MDAWAREIELQKAFEMTPSEAMMLASFEAGESIADIADRQGLNAQTVKNTLTNARKKLKGKNMEIYILKPSGVDNPSHVKRNLVEVLVRFIAKSSSIRVDYLPHIIKVSRMDRSNPGDIEWVNSNIFRYIDPVGTAGPAEIEERADKMYRMFLTKSEQDGRNDQIGFAVLKYWLDKYYISYAIIVHQDPL